MVTSKRVTLNMVNRAIEAAGGTEKLTRDNAGYFYFHGSERSAFWSGVYTFRLGDLSFEEWMVEWSDRVRLS